MTQPCDVSCFRSLKSSWMTKAADYKRRKLETTITRITIAQLLTGVVEDLSPEIVMKGFKKTGMFPWDSSAVGFSKCIGEKSQKTHDDTSDSLDVSATLDSTDEIFLDLCEHGNDSPTPEEVFDLDDSSNESLITEESLLKVIQGKLSIDELKKIARELARQKLAALFSALLPEIGLSTCSEAAQLTSTEIVSSVSVPQSSSPRVPQSIPPTVSQSKTTTVSQSQSSTRQGVCELPPKAARAGKRQTKRTSPILSGA